MAQQTVVESPPSDEVRPYRIHVSSKYIDLTRQKLELTRLPHEVVEPESKGWWEPKPMVEPLIDYWLEKYSWKDTEARLNSTLPQFRAAFHIPNQDVPIRLHFLHAKSSHEDAVPLLLIPAFPFSSLSFGHLIKLFTAPENPLENQPFHLVVPSLPGLGFSDPLPNNTHVVSTIAELLNSLMTRLGYDFYLASNTGPSATSPAQIDHKLASYLSTHYSSSCLGTHFISPPLSSPRLAEAPLEWTKWSIANFFHAGILGYADEDFSALERSVAAPRPPRKKRPMTPAEFGLDHSGTSRDPNTLAYALCDSPIGLLVFVLRSLRALGPTKEFSPEELITFAELAWLPGPEAGMRLWASVASHVDEDVTANATKKAVGKPAVGITVFLGESAVIKEEGTPMSLLPVPVGNTYACPAWGNPKYDVLYAERVPGKPGLLAWERPEVIASGVRGLARRVLERNPKLKPKKQETAPLESVVVTSAGKEGPRTEMKEVRPTEPKTEQGTKVEGERPATPGEASKQLEDPEATPRPMKGKDVVELKDGGENAGQDAGGEVAREGETSAEGEEKSKDKGKGKEVEQPEGELFFDGESPDTIIARPQMK